MSLSTLWEIVKDREAWHAAIFGVKKCLKHDLATEQEEELFGHIKTVVNYVDENTAK